MSAPSNVSPVTRVLATYLADACAEDIPTAVVHEAKRSLLNFIGCALGGSRGVTKAH